MQWKLGFKVKLRISIVSTLIGFMLLTAISFHALKILNNASYHVETVSQNAAFLKDLQVDVLQLSQQPKENALQHLLTRYGDQLDRLAQHSVPQQKETITSIRQSLADWVNVQLELLKIQEQIGFTTDTGLKTQLNQSLAALSANLFANFRDDFNVLKQNTSAFIEHRNQSTHLEATVSIDAFNKKALELEFEDFYGPKLDAIRATFLTLSDAIFTMVKHEETRQQNYLQLATHVQNATAFFDQQLATAKQEVTATSERSQHMIIAVFAVVALLVVGLLIRTSQQVVRSLASMSNALYRLANGDLTQQLAISHNGGDELDKAGLAVNEMTASLNQVLTQVSNTSEVLSGGAQDLSNNLQSMVNNNASTNEQANSVAAATEQISSSIQVMATATDEAHQKAKQAHHSATEGGEVITSAIGSLGQLAKVFDDLNAQVDELETSSRKVDGVTEMINGLAEQTNLLALNAAIEAARAGDAGRGFSVVADEVRGLAEKTVEATQHINNIIGAMHGSIDSLLSTMTEGSQHVDSGRELGDQAATAVEQIKVLVLDVTHRNQELAVNIEDASKVTRVIAENMDNVASNVSQNREQSQQVQQYVNNVSGKTTDLLSLTERFQLSTEHS